MTQPDAPAEHSPTPDATEAERIKVYKTFCVWAEDVLASGERSNHTDAFVAGWAAALAATPSHQQTIAALVAALEAARALGMKIYHNANAHEAAHDWATVKRMADAALTLTRSQAP